MLRTREQTWRELRADGLPLAISQTAYNASNRFTTWGTATLTYDANGNMLSDGTNSYVWNARNRLASMNLGGESFAYDPFGRRVAKTILGATTNYLYDGVSVAQELSGITPTANLISRGIDEVFTRADSAGARHFLADALGSTLALTDSTGTLQTSYTYEPFGNTTASGAASTSSYQYASRENDGTGLYFYRARYYNPSLQRLISEDPLEFGAGDTNLYAYAGMAATNARDPQGTWAGVDDLVFTAGGGLVGLAGQGVSDLVSGRLSSWQTYTGSIVGGVVGGETLLYAGPVVAGAAGGLVGDLTQQGLNVATGVQSQVDAGELTASTLTGAATGLISGTAIQGVNAGRNSFNSIFNQITTKFENGTISRVTWPTASKMFLGRGWDKGFFQGAFLLGLKNGLWRMFGRK